MHEQKDCWVLDFNEKNILHLNSEKSIFKPKEQGKKCIYNDKSKSEIQAQSNGNKNTPNMPNT